MAREVNTQTLIVDLAGVERINSFGVRDWVNWLTTLEKAGVATHLVSCAPAVVAQLNLVGNFSGHAAVHSFIAPYYCESCDYEHSENLRFGDIQRAPKPKAPKRSCPQCDKAMAFDDIEESYFAFTLNYAAPAGDNAAIDHAIIAADQMLGESHVDPPAQQKRPSPLERAAEKDTMRGSIAPPEIEPPSPDPDDKMSYGDMLFYLAVGALSALLLMVVYHIVIP